MEELIVKEREFRENVVKLTNEARLPAFMLKSIFKDMLEQVNMLSEQEYAKAKEILEEKNKKEADK